ncbi:MAM and LDL-receptor class A domain-containing protein 2 isoform X3 [Esox lucius]|uniref:MAM and LDL-receptor class A domain-containing protein 2 isoform X3 n=1 Tax=Esox lucius TaxID=8010 RepID=UPI0014776EA8|nr:MAM and LDL-receptor class A domain-containing protein 2 isoform X3 [Esox lucius]
MQEGTYGLLATAALLCLLNSSSYASVEGDSSSVTRRDAGTCTVHSNPHYSTFDGANFRFVGPCTYVLAKVCLSSSSSETPLPYFSIEVKNELRGNSSVSAVQKVIVQMENLEVSLHRRQNHRVMVNGIWRELPLSLNSGTINIRSSVTSIILETNLFISYDIFGSVRVTIPPSYSGKVCGICGNFNYLRDDDYLTPDGSNTTIAVPLGQSWQGGKSCDSTTVAQMCSPNKEAEYASELYCGSLVSRHGPFAGCQSVLGAESYFRSCIVEMCGAVGDTKVLCEALESYADMCRKAGVLVPSWRNSTICPLKCVGNSHYNACAEGCPEVCSSMDTQGACGSCLERCDCDPGFKLSGGRCVDAENCGCWVNGEHYESGVTFVEGECDRLCQCMGGGRLQCSAFSCAAGEVCKDKGGVKGCFPSSPVMCRIHGDPHYITFDGKAYTFQGGCSYILVKTCGGNTPVQFTVTGQNWNPSNKSSSKLGAVILETNGLHVMLESHNTTVNHVWQHLPVEVNGTYGEVKLYKNKQYTVMETSFGLRMLLDDQSRLFLQLDERYEGEVCGLCGTYSDDQSDDFLTPNSTKPESNVVVFANSWRVDSPEDNHCVANPPAPGPCDSDLDDQGNKECSKLLSEAFKPCHYFVHPSLYIDSCISDHCASGGDMHVMCDSLRSYVAACQVADVTMPPWWNNTACDSPPVPTTMLPVTTPDKKLCPLDCDFDHSECGWEQLVQDSFDWTRQRGPTPTKFTGPTQDHTTGDGSYMYIEGDGVYRGDSARMMSPSCQIGPGQYCLRFWYHMYGHATAMALNVYQLDQHETNKKLWSEVNNQGATWFPAEVDVNIDGSFRIIMEAIRGSNHWSDVAFDDISIHHGPCSSKSDMSETSIPPSFEGGAVTPNSVCNLDCDFKLDLCGFTQLLTDVFDWTRHNGSTPTAFTGPSADHTTGSGHYLYIEANSVSNGDTARLLSAECSDPGPQCLQFWYHMSGSAQTMGLHIYLLQNGYADGVWWKRNDQGDSWQLAQVDLETTGPFQIIFEGRRGTTDQSDVAIDDVSLHRGRCAEKPVNPSVYIFTTPPPSASITIRPEAPTTSEPETSNPLSVEKRAVPPHPVCNLDCNFEQDLCGFNQLLTDVFDWMRHSGSTPTVMTGPSADHTTGSGHYLYIEANSVFNGDTARLLSAECSDPGPQCLQFWYHMSGSAQTMGLHVYLLQNGYADGVWWKRNDQGDSWQLALVDLETTGLFKIIFEGRRGTTDQSDVAIDDVSLHRGSCAVKEKHLISSVDITTTPPPPVPTTFRPGPPTTARLEASNPRSAEEGAVAQHPICNLDCDFERDLCSFDQLLTDVFDWTRHSGSTPTAMTGPSADHTTGSGHYLYIEANGVSNGDTARLLSTECSDPGPQCLQFWYHMSGSAQTMGLHVYLLQDNLANRVWWKRNDQGDSWQLAQVDLETTGPFKIIFEGRRGTTDQSDVAIDDVSLHRGSCAVKEKHLISSVDITTTPPPPVPTTFRPGPPTTARLEASNPRSAEEGAVAQHPICNLDCDFERDLCSFDQLLTDVFDWTRHSGSTPTAMTGPSADHTTGSGHYLYIEANGVSNGDTARLLSTECSDPGPQCLEFWYHMSGSAQTMGLHVYLLQDNLANRVWWKRNDQGDSWQLAQVDLETTGPFKIIFEGRRGTTDQSDVAIDDVSLHRGSCAVKEKHLISSVDITTTPPPPVPTTFRPGPPTTARLEASNPRSAEEGAVAQHPICNLDCDFERDLCSFDQLLTDVFDWTRHSGSTPTAMTGPSADHTTGSGHYLYIEANGVSNGDTARLLSTECSDPGPQCLEFWYHMSGSAQTMGLHVYLLQDNLANRVWWKRNDQGDSWQLAQVDLETTGPFKIIFEGRRGTTDQSDVAIDDVSLHRGSCAVKEKHLISSVDITTTPPPPVPTTFRPGPPTTARLEASNPRSAEEGAVAQHPICNLDCDFERDLCSFDQLLTDVFDWTRHSGSTPTAMTGPSADHTTGSGHYLYIEANGVSNGDTARLLSTECSDPGPQCLQFWYHMSGSAQTMGLHVYLLQDNLANRVWWKRNDQGDSWQLAQVDLETTGPFKIIFEGRRGTTDQSDVAIDDVSLHRGRCADQTEKPLDPSVDITTTPPVPTTFRPEPPATARPEVSNLPSVEGGAVAPHPICNLDCDFERDLCSFDQLLTDVFDWTRHSGSTPTAMTGPSADHTTGSGHYLYIEANGVSNGDTARLLSAECSDPGPQCLQFWYHMSGSAQTMGLHVYILQDNLANGVWWKRNDQGDSWQLAQVDLRTTGPFKIIFEGRRGTTDQSDVAIDDVSLHRGSCAVKEKHLISSVDITTTPPPPVPTTFRPGPPTTARLEASNPRSAEEGAVAQHPICNLDCDFERDLCSFDQLLTDVFDWTRHSGSTPTAMTGPSADHTTGSGHYLYIEANGVSNGDTARLLSTECSDPGPQCLQFWYHMSGSAQTMGLHVYLLQDNLANRVWWKRNDQGDSWQLAQVDLETTGPFKIIFEGRRGTTDQSDVAIDDVSLHRGRCADQTEKPLDPSVDITTTPPVPTTFRPEPPATARPEVSNLPSVEGGAVAPHPICNLDCDFERDLCSFDQLLTDVFDWTRHSGSTPTAMTGPSADHTTGSGHYLYIEANGVSNGDTARLLSAECSDPGPQCLQFWYHMSGSAQTMGLHVYILQDNLANGVWWKRNDQGDSWQLAQVDLRTTGPFKIIFEGRRGTTDQSDVAIDDVSLHRGSCAVKALSCQKNSHFTPCISPCQPTCKQLQGPPNCHADEECIQGCVCDDGFVLREGVCVPFQHCGCVDSSGKKYHLKESWYTENCSQKCKCDEDDGVGEIECGDEEMCDGDDVCLLNEAGNYFCKSTEFSECSINRDPEYRTFDKMKHEFKGRNSYVLVQTTGLSKNQPDVYIEAFNGIANQDNSDNIHCDNSNKEEQLEDGRKSDSDEDSDEDSDDDSDDDDDDNACMQLRGIKIRVYNHTVEFRKNRKLFLDGRSAHAPVSPAGGLRILERSSLICLKTDFGLSVEFDGESRAEIILPHTYKRRVGGLCGNFDGKKNNDMVKSDGKQAESVKEFGESWRVMEERRNIT